jgi:hypothetical protein
MNNPIDIYQRMSAMKKLTLWGSTASIIGLVITFVSLHANSGNTTTSGSRSPAISNTQGDININYGESATSSPKRYVLRESQGGQPRVLKSPHTKGLLDPSEQICSQVINGTEINPLKERASQEGFDIWRKIEIVEGECEGKVGWVLSPDISRE